MLSLRAAWLTVLIAIVASTWASPALSPQKPKITGAFVVARSLYFSSTGPEPMRFDFTLLSRKRDKNGVYTIRVKAKATKDTMATNLKPGTYTYKVTAVHAKDFFGTVKDGDHIVFLEIKAASTRAASDNPTDYLTIEKADG